MTETNYNKATDLLALIKKYDLVLDTPKDQPLQAIQVAAQFCPELAEPHIKEAARKILQEVANQQGLTQTLFKQL